MPPLQKPKEAENIKEANWELMPTAATASSPCVPSIMVSIMLAVVASRFCRATGRPMASMER